MTRRTYSAIERGLLDFLTERFDGVADVEVTEEHTLYVGLSGSCADCPMRELSCTEDIAAAVKEAYPQIKSVSVRPHINEDLLDLAKKILRSSH